MSTSVPVAPYRKNWEHPELERLLRRVERATRSDTIYILRADGRHDRRGAVATMPDYPNAFGAFQLFHVLEQFGVRYDPDTPSYLLEPNPQFLLNLWEGDVIRQAILLGAYCQSRLSVAWHLHRRVQPTVNLTKQIDRWLRFEKKARCPL